MDNKERNVKQQQLGARFSRGENVLACAEEAAQLHSYLHHYTSVSNLIKMLDNRCLCLTRGNSVTLDDSQECRKYGDKGLWGRTYIACFDTLNGECAAMWGLYCQPASDAIRISIPTAEVLDLVKRIDAAGIVEGILPRTASRKLEVEKVLLSDLIYADVKGSGRGEKSRGNRLFWDKYEFKSPELRSGRANSEMTGRLKDCEWRFESESRLLVYVKRRTDVTPTLRIKVPLTLDFIRGMSFTCSPWCSDEDFRFVKRSVSTLVQKTIGEKKRVGFYKSTLAGALQKWAKSRPPAK